MATKKETTPKKEVKEITESSVFSPYANIEDNDMGCYRKHGYMSPYKCMRVQLGTERWYVDTKKDYSRGATFLSDKIQSLVSTDKFLDNWRASMKRELQGDEGFDAWMGNVSDFGTLVHELFGADVKTRINEYHINDAVKAFAEKNKLTGQTAYGAAMKATKAILAFRKFVEEHELDILSMEEMVHSEELKTTTPIDIFGIGIYKGVKSYFLVNMKTSESEGEFHKWQCAIEYLCAMNTLPIHDLPVVVLTVQPKDWKLPSGATYHMTDYTNFATDPENQETIRTISRVLIKNGAYDKPKKLYPALNESGYEILNAFI